jgi:hypothetical protein
MRSLKPLLALAILGMVCASFGLHGTSSAFTGTTSNPAGNFSAAASFATCSAGSTPPIFLTGLEAGTVPIVPTSASFFEQLVTGGGTPAADSSVKRNGAYSLRVNKSSAGTSYAARRNLNVNMVVTRLAVRLASLPAGDAQLVVITANAGENVALRYESTDSKLYFGWSSSGETAGPVVSAGTWYLIDLRFNAATDPRTANWQVNGAAQTTISESETASTVRDYRLGSGVGSQVMDVNYDDVVVSTNSADYPFGDGKVIALKPSAMGTNSGAGNFQDDDNSAVDAATWGRLDDQPMSGFTDWAKQVSASAASYLEVQIADTSETCFNGVSGLVSYAASGTSTNDGKTSVYDGATQSVVYSGVMNTTTLSYASAILTPATTWSQAAVNGLKARIGYSSNVAAVPYWNALMLEVDVNL